MERNSRRAIVPFWALVYESANNIYVHPNSTIYFYREYASLEYGKLPRESRLVETQAFDD